MSNSIEQFARSWHTLLLIVSCMGREIYTKEQLENLMSDIIRYQVDFDDLKNIDSATKNDNPFNAARE